MRGLLARIFRTAPLCTLHDVIEGGWGGQPRVYPYRCYRCGRCFVCAHTQSGQHPTQQWICHDDGIVPATPSPGVLVDSPPLRP